jgi:hypothetical protein
MKIWHIASRGIRISPEMVEALDNQLDDILQTCITVQNDFKMGQGTYSNYPFYFTNPITGEDTTIGIWIVKGQAFKMYYGSRVIYIHMPPPSEKNVLSKGFLRKGFLHELSHAIDPSVVHKRDGVYDMRGRILTKKYFADIPEINAIQSTILYNILNGLQNGSITPQDVEQWLKANEKTQPQVQMNIPGISGLEVEAYNRWKKGNPEAYRLMKQRMYTLLMDFKESQKTTSA